MKQNVEQETPNVNQVQQSVDKPQRKGKKRIPRPRNWQRNVRVRKTRKAAIKVYSTTTARHVSPRSIDRECKKCFSLIGDAKIRQIMHEFNDFGDTHLCGLIRP